MIQLIKSELITDQCSLQLCLLASFNCNKKQTNQTQYYIQGSLNNNGNNGNMAEWSLVWSVIIAEFLHAKPTSRAPWVRKSGNASMREILVPMSAYVCPSVPTDSGGGGGESQGNLMGGGECHLFLAGNRAVLLGNHRFSWQEIE